MGPPNRGWNWNTYEHVDVLAKAFVGVGLDDALECRARIELPSRGHL